MDRKIMDEDIKIVGETGSPVRRRVGLSSSLLAVMLLAGCSSVPDAVNPVEWYRGTVDAFSDDEAETAEDDAVPVEDGEFPNLGDVPDRPSADADVGEGIIADPNAPRYADSIQLQGDDDGTVVPVAEAPAAPAVPVEPVAQQSNATTPEPAAPALASVSNSAQQTAQSDVRMPSRTNTPPLVIQPGRLPSGESYEEYRERLMSGLDTSGTAPVRPVTGFARAGGGDEDLGTVVISSNGIQQGTQRTSSFSVQSSGISEAGFRRLSRDGGLLSLASKKVATIHFTDGSDDLDNRDVHVLRQVAELYKQNGGIVRVIGHASSRTRNMDEVRHKLVNYRMSAARADSVASALVRLGLPKDAIVVGAAADTQPIYREVMPTGEAGNRRAEIYIDS